MIFWERHISLKLRVKLGRLWLNRCHVSDLNDIWHSPSSCSSVEAVCVFKAAFDRTGLHKVPRAKPVFPLLTLASIVSGRLFLILFTLLAMCGMSRSHLSLICPASLIHHLLPRQPIYVH
jgi:hypothetical protein